MTVPTALPGRGFSIAEFEQRTLRMQRMLFDQRMDALFVMTEPEVRYYSGFFTQFWESPTRPWYLLIPLEGRPVAVIPGIGASGMSRTWVEDIRTWSSPNPDDDGMTLLKDAIHGLPKRFGRLGVPMGPESSLRMPALDFLKLKSAITLELVDAGPLVRKARFIKSEAEIEKIKTACDIASAAFARVPERFTDGFSEREIARRFKLDLIEAGADSAPYVMVGSGPGGYDDIIMGPGNRKPVPGDIMIIDTGTTFDGYFCDFDRNWAFGTADDNVKRAYRTVFAATEAGFQAARPGATTSDIWHAMWGVLEAGGAMGNEVGRMGHGLGMQLTEWPSNMPGDGTMLEENAVITLEPGMVFGPGQWMVHEEDIVVREGGAEWLSRRAAPELQEIPGEGI